MPFIPRNPSEKSAVCLAKQLCHYPARLRTPCHKVPMPSVIAGDIVAWLQCKANTNSSRFLTHRQMRCSL
jgi:hypothetical protein